MLHFKLFATCVAFLTLAAVTHAEDTEYKRVLVYDSGTKPSVANQSPRYELRAVRSKSDYLCKECEELAFPATSGTKPTVAASRRNEAFTCESCGNLVWLENGTEVKHTSNQDCDACKKIRNKLKNRVVNFGSTRIVDRGTKPSVQHLQERSR
jgi:hypothetical protein